MAPSTAVGQYAYNTVLTMRATPMPTSGASGMPSSALFSTTWAGLTSFMAPSSRKANTSRVLMMRPAQTAFEVVPGAVRVAVDMERLHRGWLVGSVAGSALGLLRGPG